MFSPASSHISTRWVKLARVFMLGCPVLIPIRTVCCQRSAKMLACATAAAKGRRHGGTTMAKVMIEADRGCEPAHLMLSPKAMPCPLALADRDRRAELPRLRQAWHRRTAPAQPVC